MTTLAIGSLWAAINLAACLYFVVAAAINPRKG
jgi:hypothetical protein